MDKKNKLLTFVFLAAGVPAALAADFDAVISQGLSSGYGLSADSLRLEAEAASVRAENVLEGPEAEFEHLWATKGSETRWSAGVSQSFDWPGVYGARRRQAAALGAAARAVSRSVAMDRALEIKMKILDLINARQRLRFFEEVEADVARIDSLTRRSFELEAVTVLDVRKTGLALVDCRRETSAARATVSSLEYALISLGVPPGEWTEYPDQGELAPPTPPEQMPEYLAARAREEAARASLGVIKRNSLPGFSFGFNHAYEDGRHFNGLSIGLRLPSWSRKDRVRAAELEARALADESDSGLAQAFAEEAASRHNVATLHEALEEYRGLSDDNSYLPLLRRAYDGGQLTVIDYIQEINLFRQNRLNFIDLDYQYQTALARANRYRSPYFR